MKFGLYLQDNMVQEWRKYYLQYDEFKRMIRVLAEVESKSLAPEPTLTGRIGFSLTVPPPTNAAAQPRKTADGDSDGTCMVLICLLSIVQKLHSLY